MKAALYREHLEGWRFPRFLPAQRVANWTISKVLQETREANEPIRFGLIRYLAIGLVNADRLEGSLGTFGFGSFNDREFEELGFGSFNDREFEELSRRIRFHASGVLALGLRYFVESFRHVASEMGLEEPFNEDQVYFSEAWLGARQTAGDEFGYSGPRDFAPDSAQEEWHEVWCRVQQLSGGTWRWMLMAEERYPSINFPYKYLTLEEALDDIRSLFGSVFVEVIRPPF